VSSSPATGTPPTGRPLRLVLGAEPPSRLLALATYLEHDAGLSISDRCGTYDQLLASARRTAPDLVVVDLDLLGASGAEAARRVQQAKPSRVVVLTAATERRTERARAALAAGAVAVVAESAIDLAAPSSPLARSFRSQFRRLACLRLSPAGPGNQPRGRSPRAAVIGICASTGGPQALEAVLGRLPEDFSIPVLVTQHMMPGFTGGLVSWLDQRVPPPVGVACDGQPLEPGVWFAPEGTHLLLDDRRHLALDQRPPVGGHKPSGDLLLRSLAKVAGGGAVAVVLTGMGRDGAAGLATVVAAGGRTIAQDETSSAIYGMPRVAAELGAALVLAPGGIGNELAGLAVGATS
jgi:two-component system chemotaxis response regulator CheB